MHYTTTLLLAVCYCTAAANAQIDNSRRLTDKVHTSYNSTNMRYEIFDSARYYYTKGMGFNADNQAWYFDSAIHWLYDNTAMAYGNYSRMLQWYDKHGKLSTVIYQVWDKGKYENRDRINYTYTSAVKFSISVNEAWNNGQWEQTQRTLRNYNTANELLDVEYQTRDAVNAKWLNGNKTSYTYANGKVTSETTQQYDATQMQYVNLNRMLYYYNAAGNDTLRIGGVWDNGNQTFSNTNRVVSTFDTNGNRVAYDEDVWNGGQWHKSSRITRQYDTNNNVLNLTVKIWRGSSYDEVKQYNYTYNQYGQRLTYEELSWDKTLQLFAPAHGDDFDRFYYEAFPQSINDAHRSSPPPVLAYPVPANNTLHLQADWLKMEETRLQVFDINGRLLITKEAAPTQAAELTVDISALPAGQYLLQISTAQQMAQQRITVAK